MGILKSPALGLAMASLGLSAWANPNSVEPELSMGTCIEQAAVYHHVNSRVLKAMIFQESSGRPDTVHKNSDKSADYGAAGINSVHLAELSKFGISEKSLLDGCTSAFVGAWKYSQKIAKYGNTWKAVGAYNSETPSKRNAYSLAVQRHLVRWGYLPSVFSYGEDEKKVVSSTR